MELKILLTYCTYFLFKLFKILEKSSNLNQQMHVSAEDTIRSMTKFFFRSCLQQGVEEYEPRFPTR